MTEPYCYCKLKAQVQSNSNNRRFYCCPNKGTGKKSCSFFKFADLVQQSNTRNSFAFALKNNVKPQNQGIKPGTPSTKVNMTSIPSWSRSSQNINHNNSYNNNNNNKNLNNNKNNNNNNNFQFNPSPSPNTNSPVKNKTPVNSKPVTPTKRSMSLASNKPQFTPVSSMLNAQSNNRNAYSNANYSQNSSPSPSQPMMNNSSKLMTYSNNNNNNNNNNIKNTTGNSGAMSFPNKSITNSPSSQTSSTLNFSPNSNSNQFPKTPSSTSTLSPSRPIPYSQYKSNTKSPSSVPKPKPSAIYRKSPSSQNISRNSNISPISSSPSSNANTNNAHYNANGKQSMNMSQNANSPSLNHLSTSTDNINYSQQNDNNNNNNNSPSSNGEFPERLCPKHNVPCKFGYVKKESANQGRPYYVCQIDGPSCCFIWGDNKPNQSNKRRNSSSKDSSAENEIPTPGRYDVELQAISHGKELGVLATYSPIVKNRAIAVFHSVGGGEIANIKHSWQFPWDSFQKLLKELKSEFGMRVSSVPPEVIRTLPSYAPADLSDPDSVDWSRLPDTLRNSLLPFQWDSVMFAVQRKGRILIGDEMGLGKTVQAIAIACYYRNEWPVLIVCPSSMRSVWHAELRKWCPNLKEEEIALILTGRHKPNKLVNIISYDLASKFIASKKITPEEFPVVIADESHYLKNMGAKRTVHTVPLLKQVPRAVLLTGTPALSRPIELFSQVSAVAPGVFNDRKWFGFRYCDPKPNPFGVGTLFKGAKNLSELHAMLERTVMIRRLKSEVLQELPSKRRQAIWVEPGAKERKQFRSIFKNLDKIKDTLEKSQESSEKSDLGFQRNSHFTELYHATGVAKIPKVLEYINDIVESEEQFLLFAHHREVLNSIEDRLEKKKVDYIRIDGDTPSELRGELAARFRNEKKCQFALLSITAAGCGLTLTPCSNVVITELYWTPGSLIQAEDRVHRVGQKSAVNIRYVLARGTLDDKIWPMICRKLEVLGHSLDGQATKFNSSRTTWRKSMKLAQNRASSSSNFESASNSKEEEYEFDDGGDFMDEEEEPGSTPMNTDEPEHEGYHGDKWQELHHDEQKTPEKDSTEIGRKRKRNNRIIEDDDEQENDDVQDKEKKSKEKPPTKKRRISKQNSPMIHEMDDSSVDKGSEENEEDDESNLTTDVSNNASRTPKRLSLPKRSKSLTQQKPSPPSSSNSNNSSTPKSDKSLGTKNNKTKKVTKQSSRSKKTKTASRKRNSGSSQPASSPGNNNCQDLNTVDDNRPIPKPSVLLPSEAASYAAILSEPAERLDSKSKQQLDAIRKRVQERRKKNETNQQQPVQKQYSPSIPSNNHSKRPAITRNDAHKFVFKRRNTNNNNNNNKNDNYMNNNTQDAQPTENAFLKNQHTYNSNSQFESSGLNCDSQNHSLNSRFSRKETYNLFEGSDSESSQQIQTTDNSENRSMDFDDLETQLPQSNNEAESDEENFNESQDIGDILSISSMPQPSSPTPSSHNSSMSTPPTNTRTPPPSQRHHRRITSSNPRSTPSPLKNPSTFDNFKFSGATNRRRRHFFSSPLSQSQPSPSSQASVNQKTCSSNVKPSNISHNNTGNPSMSLTTHSQQQYNTQRQDSSQNDDDPFAEIDDDVFEDLPDF